MRNRALAILAIIAAIVMVSGPAFASHPLPRSYVMKCKGGGGMVIDLRDNDTTPPLEILINFKKARNSRNLRPGECSWLDRTINKNEPSRLWFPVVYHMQPNNIFLKRRFKRLIWKTNGNRIKKIETSMGPINRILAAAMKGREFFVHVYNNANRRRAPRTKAFIVTKLGP